MFTSEDTVTCPNCQGGILKKRTDSEFLQCGNCDMPFKLTPMANTFVEAAVNAVDHIKTMHADEAVEHVSKWLQRLDTAIDALNELKSMTKRVPASTWTEDYRALAEAIEKFHTDVTLEVIQEMYKDGILPKKS